MGDFLENRSRHKKDNLEIARDLESYSRLNMFSDMEKDVRAKMQQEIGIDLVPHIFKLLDSDDLNPYTASRLLRGIDGNDEVLYDSFKKLALTKKVYQDLDHSGIHDAIVSMSQLARDKSGFVKDIALVEEAIKKDSLKFDPQGMVQHLIVDVKNNFDRYKTSMFESIAYKRKESKERYMGIDNRFTSMPNIEILGLGKRMKIDGPMDLMDIFSTIMDSIGYLDIDPDSKEYLIFDEIEQRKEIVMIGKKVSEYVHDRGIEDIIFVDRASRPAYISVVENWKRMYPEDPVPNIYFMNPKGFRSQTDILKNPKRAIMDLLGGSRSSELDESPRQIRSRKDIRQDLKKSYPKLFSKADKHVLLFDTCIHTGDSIKPMIDTLTNEGLDVRVGVVSSQRNGSGIEADLVVTDNPVGGCYPFDRDEMVEKSYSSVHSFKNRDEGSQVLSRRIRKEIRMALNENFE